MSETASAPSDLASERDRLQRDHALLHERIEQLEQQLYMTPQQQMMHRRLKKMKLALKDQLTRLSSRQQADRSVT